MSPQNGQSKGETAACPSDVCQNNTKHRCLEKNWHWSPIISLSTTSEMAPYANFIRKFWVLFSATFMTKTNRPQFKKNGYFLRKCLRKKFVEPHKKNVTKRTIPHQKQSRVTTKPSTTMHFLRKRLTQTKSYANGLRSKKHRRFGPPR